MTAFPPPARMSRLRRLLGASVLALGVAHGMPAAHAAVPDSELPGEILVKLDTASALGPLLVKHGLSLVAKAGARPIFRLKVAGPADLHDKIAALSLEPAVQIVEGNVVHTAPEARKNGAWAIGTPTQYVDQWAPNAIRLARAQKRSRGAGVRVAVLDTGVDTTHPALAGRLLPGRDFVDGDNDASEVGSTADAAFGHGTHVAGLVALVAPDAAILPLRVLDPAGQGDAWSLAAAILHAVDPDGDPATDDGAHVINMSLGSTARTHLMDVIARLASCAAFTQPVGEPGEDVSDAGYDDDRARCLVATHGAVVVAAAGNDGSDSVRQYPAAENAYGLLAVAASGSNGRLAPFSNSGGWISLAAPGDGITSTVPGGGYGTWSGTSMASPLVAGVAALLRAAEKKLVPDDVARRIERTGADLCGTKLKQLDAAAAVAGAPTTRACR